jgi:hypothetical protein
VTLKKQRHISVASQPTQCEIGNRYEFLSMARRSLLCDL